MNWHNSSPGLADDNSRPAAAGADNRVPPGRPTTGGASCRRFSSDIPECPLISKT